MGAVKPVSGENVDDLLRRLQDAGQELVEALKGCDPQQFEAEDASGESVKQVLERTVDDLNFYYGRLVARAMGLPQPPCLEWSGFLSLREAVMSVQVAQRRYSNLLHDLIPADLERQAVDQEHGTYSMRQLLEMSAAHYAMRTQQVARITDATSGRE